VATLDKVAVEITVVLGTTSMPIHQVLRLAAARSSSWTPPKKTQSASLPTTRRWSNRTAVNVAELLPRPQTCVDGAAARVARKLSLQRAAAGLVPQHPICYMVRHHWTRGSEASASFPMRSWRNW
jgi:flagellar motor switch protein FliN/FliY